MPTFFQAVDMETTDLNQKQISIAVLHLFSCCLSVVLSFEKGDYPKNLHVVFGPDKYHSV